MIITLKPQETVEAVYWYFEREETSWNVLYLKNVAEHSPLIRHVPPRASAFAVGLRSGYLSPYVTRRGAWEDYIRNRSKNFRKQLSNKRNAFVKHVGHVAAREYRTPEEVNAALSIAFDVDSKAESKEGNAMPNQENQKYWEC
jgi:CelD/BcsL family acetyltransferase involved in cellulose biosynthesis